jgi:ABC-type transport system involved in cytochrome bd biosynthesis fused ATPase/permease subunit
LAIFGLYTGVQGNALTASVAYTTISLLEIVRDNATVLSSISIYIPKIQVSLKRIDRYLAAATCRDAHAEGPVQIRNVTIRRSASSEFRLHDISVEFIQGGINAVVGPSGSGKTTLLVSILGESILESGSISRPKDVAFASQSPWLQAVSLRENVLFTADYNAVKYGAIIEACCLNEDLKEMPGGDSTNVGISGQALSGTFILYVS